MYKDLTKAELENISGGSQFSRWLARMFGSYCGSVANQNTPNTWAQMEATYGSNYHLWP